MSNWGLPDPGIEEALRELGSSRVLEILLVMTTGKSCDAILLGLAALGHHVVVAQSDKQALEKFYRQAFDLVVCDQASEESRCDELAAYLRTLDPRQRIVAMDLCQSSL